MFSKQRFAACTAPITMAEHPRFLAMLGMTSYRRPTIPSPLMRPLRNSNICHCHSERSSTPTSVIPNAAQRSEESQAHVLQTAFRGLHASDDDGGTL